MTENSIDNMDINHFYQNRKKFDNMITNFLGSDVHLHDLSGDSLNRSNDLLESSFGKPSNLLSEHNINRVGDNGQNQVVRMSRQISELKKRNQLLKDENSEWKQKASLWQQTKKFVIQKVHPSLELKSVKFKSSDNSILKEFLITLEEIISMKEKINDYPQLMYNCEMQEERMKKLELKSEKDAEENMKIVIENQRLSQENKFLSEKIELLNENRKKRFTQFEQNMQQKFNTLKNDLEEEKKENDRLRGKIQSIEKLGSSKSKNQDKEKEENEKKMLLQISKMKEEELNFLGNQNRSLHEKLLESKKREEKMKYVLMYAKQINDDQMNKLEEFMLKEKNDYQHEKMTLNTSAESDRNKMRVLLPQKTRFKVIRSRSTLNF